MLLLLCLYLLCSALLCSACSKERNWKERDKTGQDELYISIISYLLLTLTLTHTHTNITLRCTVPNYYSEKTGRKGKRRKRRESWWVEGGGVMWCDVMWCENGEMTRFFSSFRNVMWRDVNYAMLTYAEKKGKERKKDWRIRIRIRLRPEAGKEVNSESEKKMKNEKKEMKKETIKKKKKKKNVRRVIHSFIWGGERGWRYHVKKCEDIREKMWWYPLSTKK